MLVKFDLCNNLALREREREELIVIKWITKRIYSYLTKKLSRARTYKTIKSNTFLTWLKQKKTVVLGLVEKRSFLSSCKAKIEMWVKVCVNARIVSMVISWIGFGFIKYARKFIFVLFKQAIVFYAYAHSLYLYGRIMLRVAIKLWA